MLHFANIVNAVKNIMVDMTDVNKESATPAIIRNVVNCVSSNICGVMAVLCLFVEFPVYESVLFILFGFCYQSCLINVFLFTVKTYFPNLFRFCLFVVVVYFNAYFVTFAN